MSFLKKLKKTNVDENEVVTDRAFMRSIITSFFAIVMCIIMLGASTYAWFTKSIEATSTITSAVYVLSITAQGDENNDTVSEPIYHTEQIDGNNVYTFKAGVTYTITATIIDEKTTAKTGYIKLVVGDKTFVSQQIDRSTTDAASDPLSFTLKYDEETKVTIIEGWGMSSVLPEDRDIKDGANYSNLK